MYRIQNRVLPVLLCVVLLASLVLACVPALAATYPFTTVTSDSVNMRRSASSSATVLERLNAGETITVTGVSGNYYKVSARSRTGYVLKTYVVEPMAPLSTQTPTATGYPYMTTTSDSVNLREKASTSSKVLKTLSKGASVTVRGVSGDFAQVTYNSTSGYVMTRYLNLLPIVTPTAVPTAAPTMQVETGGYQMLQQGQSGSAVRALQTAMIELGYLTGTADGYFGTSTFNAVRAFQTKNNYPSTGLVDANLQAFIYNGKPKNASGTAVTVMTLPPLDDVTIRLNNRGELVETVQIRLKELGYYTGNITGVFDSASQTAVKAFQKKNGLKADGLAGVETRKVLLSGNALSATATATPVPTATPRPTATPTAAPTFSMPSATVRQGSTGDNARLVQNRLKQLGYYTGKVDGKFGADSVTALKAFQKKNGLTADGVAGSGTYRILFSYSALGVHDQPVQTITPPPAVTAAPATPVPTAIPTPEPITPQNVVVVKLGVTGEAVSRLQQRLTDLGYYRATVDGKCKADDVAAIKAFQSKNGLKVDGAAGYDTQVKLYSVTAVTATGSISGGTVDTFATLRKGSTGTAVTMLQERLIQLKYMTGKADGVYGDSTVNAVIAFQRAVGLTRDGVAGPATQSLLYSATAPVATQAPATAAPAATPTAAPQTTVGTGTTLRLGDSNNAVKQLQQRLIELGFLTGKADGVFGTKTYQAVKAFQKAYGLTSDGVAGARTLARLNTATTAPQTTAGPVVTIAPQTTVVTPQTVRASMVKYENWYTTVKAKARSYPYATVYDFSTGISWQVHMFSLGAHADSEPLTATDTANMERAFGGNTWTPKPVWVIMGDGTVWMASTHSMPHEVQHITTNNFAGHLCIHFPRTAAQVAAIGPYATSHQAAIDKGWQTTQNMK